MSYFVISKTKSTNAGARCSIRACWRRRSVARPSCPAWWRTALGCRRWCRAAKLNWRTKCLAWMNPGARSAPWLRTGSALCWWVQMFPAVETHRLVFLLLASSFCGSDVTENARCAFSLVRAESPERSGNFRWELGSHQHVALPDPDPPRRGRAAPAGREGEGGEGEAVGSCRTLDVCLSVCLSVY